MKQKTGYKNLRRYKDWNISKHKDGKRFAKFKGDIYEIKFDKQKDIFWFKDKENNKFDVTNIIYGV